MDAIEFDSNLDKQEYSNDELHQQIFNPLGSGSMDLNCLN
jgi:hypothetical protein